ncbi:unnamed protein product [Alopecurus aequalis]
MSVPKLSTMVVLLLLASLPAVVVSTVDPSNPADTSEGAPQRIGHLHLEGRGSEKTTLAVRGDNLRIPRFADQEGTWHDCTDDLDALTPPARMSCNDGDDYSSVLSGHKRFKDLRVGKDPTLDALVKLARSAATMLDDGSKIMSMILDDRQPEPVDIWKTMSCAVLLAEQNGGAWRSKEAMQLRSIGLYSKEDVLKQLRIIAWPNDCSEPITLDSDSL